MLEENAIKLDEGGGEDDSTAERKSPPATTDVAATAPAPVDIVKQSKLASIVFTMTYFCVIVRTLHRPQRHRPLRRR